MVKKKLKKWGHPYYYPRWLVNILGFLALVLLIVATLIAIQIKDPDIQAQTYAMGVIGLSAFVGILYFLAMQHNDVIP